MQRVLTALLVLAAAVPAWGDVALAPSEALRCMTPVEAARQPLQYPQAALEAKAGGLVRAEMVFEDPALPPAVKVTNRTYEPLAQAVMAHLRERRVPCLAPGQKAVLTQEFKFDPTDGRRILWSNMREAQTGEEARDRGCTATMPRATYPEEALRRDQMGVVALRLRFADNLSPPEVTVLDETPGDALIRSTVELVAASRMSCSIGRPVDFHFYYQYGDGTTMVLNDVPLRTYLRGVKGIQQAQVYFDFNELKCPFDVRVKMMQPVRDNLVGELGEAVPERVFFLDWLSRQRLDLTPGQQNRLIGQSTTISVPCGTLNLGSTQGGGASQ